MSDDRAPELRVSDADREQVAERLRDAAGDGQLSIDELDERLDAAYRSRTFRELEPLTADLQLREGDRAGDDAAFSVRRGPGGAGWLFAVHGRLTRDGRWRLAKRCTLVSLFGHGELDLSAAEFADDQVELRVMSLLGTAEVRVPQGLRVEVSKAVGLGLNQVDLAGRGDSAFAPAVHVRLVTLLGRSRVTRAAPLASSRRLRPGAG